MYILQKCFLTVYCPFRAWFCRRKGNPDFRCCGRSVFCRRHCFLLLYIIHYMEKSGKVNNIRDKGNAGYRFICRRVQVFRAEKERRIPDRDSCFPL